MFLAITKFSWEDDFLMVAVAGGVLFAVQINQGFRMGKVTSNAKGQIEGSLSCVFPPIRNRKIGVQYEICSRKSPITSGRDFFPVCLKIRLFIQRQARFIQLPK